MIQLSDDKIYLKLERIKKRFGTIATDYFFDIHLQENDVRIGRCDYRPFVNIENYYAGNIGYMIYPEFRGNNYSLRASVLLCKMAKKNRSKLLITCSPDNFASYRIITKLGGKLIKTIKVPKRHFLYKQGEKIKCIFKIDLKSF